MRAMTPGTSAPVARSTVPSDMPESIAHGASGRAVCRAPRLASGAAVDRLPRGRDLRLHRRGIGEGALGAAIPPARIVEVTLENVDDAVKPRGQRGLLLLHDRVGGLPV